MPFIYSSVDLFHSPTPNICNIIVIIFGLFGGLHIVPFAYSHAFACIYVWRAACVDAPRRLCIAARRRRRVNRCGGVACVARVNGYKNLHY